METKFLIIDGNSLGCRAAFAHNPKMGPDLCNFDGHPTGATYRFFNMFDRLLHQIKPTHAVVAWDLGGETFRKKLDPEYKANREKKKNSCEVDNVHIQFDDIRSILELIGVNNVSARGFEGDDIVGTYVKLSEANKNFIITGDKDAFQLVSDKTVVVFPQNGFKEIQIVTPEYVAEKYAIPFEKFVDLKALMGDDGDNIKGIDGCGEKTAVKLLTQFGSAEAVSWSTESEMIEMKGINKRVLAGVKDWSKRYETVMQLVTIRDDVPVPYTFEECELNFNWSAARPHFKKFDFNSFLRKLDGGEFYGDKQ